MRALERFTERLIDRQRELYAADEPFVEKWRTAMRYLVGEDRTYEKVWLELQALAWNDAGLREPPRARQRGVERGAHRGVRGAAPRARDRDAARGARLARDDVQHSGSSSSASAASRQGTPSSWSGSTDGCRADAPDGEQTRARYPDESGYVERDGVRLHYEVYGTGEPTVLLLPTWSIIHSRHWKMQIPYLARHCRVVTFDGRGNGRSDRPPSRGLREASSPPTRSRYSTRQRPSVPSSSRCRGAHSARCSWRPSTRSASTALVFIGPALPLPQRHRG